MLGRYFLTRIFSGNLDADETLSPCGVCRKGRHSRSSFLTVRMYGSWNHGTMEVHTMSWVGATYIHSSFVSEDILIYVPWPFFICFQTSQWHAILRRCSRIKQKHVKAKIQQTRQTLWIYMFPVFWGILPSPSRSSKEPWLDRFLLSRIGTEMLTSHYVASMEAWSGGRCGFGTWTFRCT